jgi:hypothetical protein
VLRYALGGVCLLLGPVAFLSYAAYLGTALSQGHLTASAEVVAVKPYRGGGHSRSYCPVFRVQIDGKPVEVESAYCANDESDFTVGQVRTVRYPPSDLHALAPDDFWKAHDEALPLAAASGFFTVVAAFMLWPNRRQNRAVKPL